jgi:hydroxymethylbilane synthase
MAQVQEVAKKLDGFAATEIIKIKTTGDKITDRALADVGGKGLFSKEIDAAMLDGRIDIAVHSAKDLETRLADGIELAAVLEREDPRDVLICRDAAGLDDLPAGSVVGTASIRRQAQLLYHRPDLSICLIRGNVQTRLRKLNAGECDATLLALSGLNRLGMAHVATEILDPDVLLPAVAQGAIGVTCRDGDMEARAHLKAINHAPSAVRIAAERAMLHVLDGTCHTPIGGLATLGEDGTLTLRGLVARADGSEVFRTVQAGPETDAEAIGREAGADLKAQAGPDLFD